MTADNQPEGATAMPGTLPTTPAAPTVPDDGLAIHQRANLLRLKGFQQTEVVDPITHRPAVMWVRVWRGVRDALIASGEREAIGYRVWDADFNPHKPLDIEDDLRLWQQAGPFLAVSAALLALDPHPRDVSHFPSTRPATGEQS